MPDSIICPRCGLRSYHPKDIEERYCGHCHEWHANMREAAQLYRLWEHGEDMGLARRRVAFLWLEAAKMHYHPRDGEMPRIEPVADDAPEFLSRRFKFHRDAFVLKWPPL